MRICKELINGLMDIVSTLQGMLQVFTRGYKQLVVQQETRLLNTINYIGKD